MISLFLAILMMSQISFADEVAVTRRQNQMMYRLMCVANSREAKTMPDQFQNFQAMLKDPQGQFEALLNEGDKSDTGPFGLIVACGLILQVQPDLIRRGCKDENGQRLDPKPALDACQKLIDHLKSSPRNGRHSAN